MSELPKEQVTQRSGRSSVSAPTTDIASPYAVIWDAETNYHETTVHILGAKSIGPYGVGEYGIGPYGPAAGKDE